MAFLAKLGIETVLAVNGQDAINKMETETFDLVLMDCQMPVMDGYSATQALRAKKIDTPIIALTANAMQADKEACFAAGMNDFIAKPFKFLDLKAKIAYWLHKQCSIS